MYRLNVKKFGFALGLTGALIYLGCMIVMATAGQEGSITFFNSLAHGLDVTTIIRMDVPLSEALIGIIQIFILGWLIGACIAAFYNAQIKNK
ncbi:MULTISPECIES: DUF5676 family membrane protein [Flavobacteriaceae]|uniref:Uncharacterized protein n=3 Tax=Flavobacteriaceae TaxID=49546 RepID=A0AC61Y4F6_9FLAO|nr:MULTISPECIES: DUF5676 family membrane protein [Flavobacteriaceae]MBJ98728.1 hypothetical protein [Flavobacteriaceae bacterium]MAN29505.1 hypothetical protein [Mesonia sp.]MAQ41641.1 hypothetical protein [Mesonia sp.]MDR6301728.1 hypothetical protein [Mesonia maritima]MDT0641933.1 DUF5676 family membrane protein [Zunongwangia sp. F363]|tara:strand:- start:347 stop:622 length:276 start_codon:yes stop_codon:yes gene_type:complete